MVGQLASKGMAQFYQTNKIPEIGWWGNLAYLQETGATSHTCIPKFLKKFNYLRKYRRYAFWIFRIISSLESPLPVENTIFPQQLLISEYVIFSKDWRQKSQIISENIADRRFES